MFMSRKNNFSLCVQSSGSPRATCGRVNAGNRKTRARGRRWVMGEKGLALEEEGCGQGRFPPSLLGLGWEGAKAKAGGSWGDEPRAG